MVRIPQGIARVTAEYLDRPPCLQTSFLRKHGNYIDTSLLAENTNTFVILITKF